MKYDVAILDTFTAELPHGVKFISKIVSYEQAKFELGEIGFSCSGAIRYRFERFGKKAECIIPIFTELVELEDIEKEFDMRAALEIRKLYIPSLVNISG